MFLSAFHTIHKLLKSKAAVRRSGRCSIKQVFLKLYQNSQETIPSEFLFNEVAGLRSEILFKNRLQQRHFPVNFAKSLRTSFYMNNPDGCFFKIYIAALIATSSINKIEYVRYFT